MKKLIAAMVTMMMIMNLLGCSASQSDSQRKL